MKRTLILLTILLFGFTKGYSCRCNQMNLKNEIDAADLILQGIPVSKRQIDSKMIYKFHVDKIWKGTFIDSIDIETASDSRSCGMVFEIGKTYVVYSKNGLTSYCRRNSLIDNTLDDLKLDYRFLPEYVSTSFTGSEKLLNDKESDYLNQQFNGLLDDYDFKGKSILFTSNLKVISKLNWFEYFWIYDIPVASIIKLTEKEKTETGYDAILVTYNKRKITDIIKQRILKQIKR